RAGGAPPTRIARRARGTAEERRQPRNARWCRGAPDGVKRVADLRDTRIGPYTLGVTFFRSLLVAPTAAAALLLGCNGDSHGDVHGIDGGDAHVSFDAHVSETGAEAGADLGEFDASCGTTGCLTVTSCRPSGAIVDLDTDTRAMPSSVSIGTV